MNNKIMYLSFFSPEEGLLFPDELPDQYFAPGLFVAEEEQDGSLAYRYSFDAMDAGRRVEFDLVRQDEADPTSNLYVVRTKQFGFFYFSLVGMNPWYRYRGKRKSLRDHGELRIAVTRDSQKLERVCQNFEFYFIGSTLSEDGDG